MEHRDEVAHRTWVGKKYEEAENKIKEALLNKMVGGANTTVH